MAYEVTATRRRPQRFEDLAGQEFVAETLKNSIKTGQNSHAYLHSEPEKYVGGLERAAKREF